MKKIIKFIISLCQKAKHRKVLRADITSTILGKCSFEGENTVGKSTYLKNTALGYATYMGADNEFSSCIIGKYCSIGSGIHIVASTHPSKTTVSTHPAFFSTQQKGLTYVKETKFNEILSTPEGYSAEIGNDVWIGDHVYIKGGVKIGDGAIVAMGSVITKDVPPYAIVGGVPAKEIRRRFSDEYISRLLEIKWWDKPKSWIEKNADKFYDIEQFFEEI